MTISRESRTIVSGLVAALLAAAALAQEAHAPAETLTNSFPKKSYSPHAARNFPTRPFFGDTHVHTGASMDAGAFGARLGPADAFRFASGEEVTAANGMRVKLARPLDFIVVADHSDNMGFFPKLFAGDPSYLADPTGKKWYDDIQKGGEAAVAVATDVIDRFSKNTFPPALASLPGTQTYRDAWEVTINAAEKYNRPNQFTAFIGFEWTSNTGGNNLHRVVIFRDGGDKAGQVEPFATVRPSGSDDPKDLWKYLQAYEDKTGGRLLAIAHNGNLSNGIMFPEIDSFTGKPITKEYAETRARWEPLYEATQIKGDGEAHPYLSPTDELAGYEIWDKFNLNMSVPKEKDMLQYEYARTALQIGLQLEAKLGTNPYKFGMIGSTDTHTALSTADEDNFFGKHSGTEPNPKRMSHPVGCFGDNCIIGWQQAASGYAAVWATENTREALFAAMERKETYATTGPRMTVRFFGGWDFVPADAANRLPADVGYAKGVPMGGDLRCRARGQIADLPGRRNEGSALRQPRSHPDREGLGRREGCAPGKGLRRRLVRQAQARRGRQAAGSREHGRRRERNLDQHDRRIRADHRVEGSGLRSEAARGLLRARDRDPDAALDDLRCQVLRRRDSGRRAHLYAGTGLHLAHLVHALRSRAVN